MKIKDRLSLYFALIGSSVLMVVLVSVYFTFYTYVRNDFFSHLKDRATVAAQLYLEADEITADSLIKVRSRYLNNLPEEVIRIYDSRNTATFIKESKQYWDSRVIERVRKQKFLEYSDNDHQVVGIYYLDNQGDFVILVSAIDQDGVNRLNILLKTILVIFFIIGALLFFVSRFLAQTALSPIQYLVKQMDLIKPSNLNLRVDEGAGKDEISELARNFNGLIERLENAFEQQKIYVANASHELRTPVTTIIGELELALSKERGQQENEHTMKIVLQESEKLKDTITGLMDLAQIDMDYTIAELSRVRMDELLWEIYDYWVERYGKDKFIAHVLNLPDDESTLTLNANKQLLTIAFNNLIANAYKFSDNKAVTFTFYGGNKVIRLEIIDTGIGIPESDFENVFKSFYRADNAHSFSGNGIGLYITHKIIQLFNGTIEIQSTESIGTTVIIQFNLG